MNEYVSIQHASEQLGCTAATLFRDCEKYRPYIRLATEGKRNAGFNLSAFRANEENRHELLEKTKLLTEYLHHIEKVTYVKMSKISGVPIYRLSGCNYSFKAAYDIAKSVRNEMTSEFDRFHKYYGWKNKI